MTTQTLQCSSEQLFAWFDKHLDDCPCDWHTLDYASEGVTIAFHTVDDIKEENSNV